jgi:uncharacterized protein (TIGR03435 family)
MLTKLGCGARRSEIRRKREPEPFCRVIAVMRIPVAVLLAASGCGAAHAQSFEVASVRESAPGVRRTVIGVDPDTLTLRSFSLRHCIEWAYQVQTVQISGPAWLMDEDGRYDITAKTAERTSEDEMRLMLQGLLADRFGLKFHHEKKELSVYLLTAGKNGPNFHDVGPKNQSKFVESKNEGPVSFGRDKTGLTAECIPMSEIANRLSEQLQRPVVDKTGLTGRYDIRLDFSAFLDDGDGGGAGRMDSIAFIFSGFQTQLGLKLEAEKEAVDFLVIESANKTPTQN